MQKKLYCFRDVVKNDYGKTGEEVEAVGSYGNAKTVTAYLNGLSAEDLDPGDFDYNDKYYPLIIYAG